METTLVILAAGNSKRMGSPKGLVSYRKQALIDYQIDQFAKAGGKRVLLILGTHLSLYQKHFQIESHSFSKNQLSISIIHNNHLDWGPFYSLQLGLKESPAAILMTPVDSPLPQTSLLKELMASKSLAAQPIRDGKKGHPVFISAKLAATLLTLPPKESRLDHILRQIDQLELISTQDERIHLNLNTPSHLKTN